MNFPAFRIVCLVGLLTVLAAPAHALLAVDEDFDSYAVGSFPTGLTNALVGPNSYGYVTNSIAGTPSSPNVLLLNYGTNLWFGDYVAPIMATTPLSTDSVRPFTVSFDVRVDQIPADGSAGLFFRLNSPIGPVDGSSSFRWLAGSGGTWQWIDPLSATNNLSTGVWYNVRMETVLANNGSNTVTEYYLNDTLFYTKDQSMATAGTLGRTNISSMVFAGYIVTAGGNNLIFFDNLRVEIIPEPSTVLLIGVGGWLLWRFRRGFRLR